MFIRGLIVIACFGVLTSCATAYKKPTTPNTAKLLVYAPQTETFASVQMIGYESGQCENPMSLGMIGGIANNTNDEKLNIPRPAGYRAEALVERLIPAGSRYLFSMRGFLPGRTCVITISFEPAVGGNYTSRMRWENNACYLEFGQIKKLPAEEVKIVDEPTFKREQACTKGLT